MVATRVPPPPFNTPVLDGRTFASAWKYWIQAINDAIYGEGFDKVDAGYQTAAAAAPASAQVVAVGGLQGSGSAIGENVGIALYRAITGLSGLPATGNHEGDWAYCLDGRKTGEGAGAGTGVPVWWSNGGWYAADSGAAVAA